MQFMRRNSARELARSIAEVGEGPQCGGKKTVTDYEAECRGLALAAFTQGGRTGATAPVDNLNSGVRWKARSVTLSRSRILPARLTHRATGAG